jgi:hypothetical protein
VAQRMAISVRIGRPRRAPQVTPRTSPRTSPSSTARREEMLAGFEQNSENERRKACHNSTPPIPEADHRQQRQRQVGAEVLRLVVDVQATDGHHQERCGWRTGTDDHAIEQHAQRDRIRVRRILLEAFQAAGAA